MYHDEIIKEVWANRKEFSDKHHHDIDAMVEELKIRQGSSTRNVVDRRMPPNKAIQSDSLDARR